MMLSHLEPELAWYFTLVLFLAGLLYQLIMLAIEARKILAKER